MELRDRHEAHLEKVDQLWARSLIEVRWRDDRGRSRFEQGEGILIVRRPADLALTAGKLGRTMLWLGCDEERFWWFDLNPPSDQPTVAYLGRHDEADRYGMEQLPLPVQPGRLLELLGLVDLPDPEAAQIDTVEADRTAYHRIRAREGPDVAGHAGTPLQREFWLDQDTGRLARVRFLLEDQPIAESRLGVHEPMRLAETPRTRWPEMPARIEVHLPRRETQIILFLSDQTDGKADAQVQDVQFDFDQLVAIHQPEEVRVLAPQARE